MNRDQRLASGFADVVFHQFHANVLGTIYTTNTFLPLLRRSTAPLKKVISLSSAAGDVDFVRATEFPLTPAYATSKAGLNLVMSKYAVEPELKGDGVVFLSISPGFVNTIPEGVDPGKPGVISRTRR